MVGRTVQIEIQLQRTANGWKLVEIFWCLLSPNLLLWIFSYNFFFHQTIKFNLLSCYLGLGSPFLFLHSRRICNYTSRRCLIHHIDWFSVSSMFLKFNLSFFFSKRKFQLDASVWLLNLSLFSVELNCTTRHDYSIFLRP